ncbi:MAG TPA: hypothetical protein VIL23_01095 [Clostridia bacterium]
MRNWLARLGSFLLGVIFGVIAAVGGLVYLGVWSYKNLTINKIGKITKQDLAFLDAFLEQNAAIKDMSIEQIILSVSSIPNKTLDEIALEYGVKYPDRFSFLIDALKDVKVGQIANSLGNAVSKIKIGDILGAPYNDFETYPPEYQGPAPLDATPILWAIRYYTLSNVSANILSEVKIGSILGPPYDDTQNPDSAAPDGASPLIWAIRTYTINNLSENVMNEIKIGVLLGKPYSDFETYPENYQGALPGGADSMLWALRNYTLNNMSQNLLSSVKIGSILGDPYGDFETYPEDYDGPVPQGADALLWDLRTYTIQGEKSLSSYPDSLTAGDLKTVFNVSLPEILDIDDSVPLKNLGDEINNMYIYKIIDPPSPDSDKITQNIINKIRFLKKDGTVQDPAQEPAGDSDWYRLGELNELMNNLPSALTSQDVLKNPAELDLDKISKVIMQKLYDGNYKVTELSQKLPEILNNTYIDEIIDEPDESVDFAAANIINTLRTMTYDNGQGAQVRYSLNEINKLVLDLPANLTVQSVIKEPQTGVMADNILYKIWASNARLTELDTKLKEVFESLTFADILEEPENPETVTGRIIQKLRTPQNSQYWKVTQIEDAFNTLTFGDLYPAGDNDKGVLSLIDPSTPLDQVPAEIENVIQNTTMKDLYEKGIIQNKPNSLIENYTIDQIIEFINENLPA